MLELKRSTPDIVVRNLGVSSSERLSTVSSVCAMVICSQIHFESRMHEVSHVGLRESENTTQVRMLFAKPLAPTLNRCANHKSEKKAVKYLLHFVEDEKTAAKAKALRTGGSRMMAIDRKATSRRWWCWPRSRATCTTSEGTSWATYVIFVVFVRGDCNDTQLHFHHITFRNRNGSDLSESEPHLHSFLGYEAMWLASVYIRVQKREQEPAQRQRPSHFADPWRQHSSMAECMSVVDDGRQRVRLLFVAQQRREPPKQQRH